MTVSIEQTVSIARPLAEVFAYVSDMANWAQWQSTTVEAQQTSEGGVLPGARGRGVYQFLGRRWESPLEVTAYEPDRRVAIASRGGPVPFTYDTLLEADGASVRRVTVRGEFEPGGFFRLAEPILARVGRSQFDAEVSTLKELLEAGAVEVA
jgi:uncharacterized protein YndB with AHSA1/START domain